MKLISTNFDKLLLTVIFAALLVSWLVFGVDMLFQLLRDVTVAIITLAGARRLQDAQNQSNVENVEKMTVNAPVEPLNDLTEGEINNAVEIKEKE